MTSQNSLPETGFIRIADVLRHVPVSRASWWAGVRAGRYPKAVKLSSRITAWRVEDIRGLIDKLSKESAQSAEHDNAVSAA